MKEAKYRIVSELMVWGISYYAQQLLGDSGTWFQITGYESTEAEAQRALDAVIARAKFEAKNGDRLVVVREYTVDLMGD